MHVVEEGPEVSAPAVGARITIGSLNAEITAVGDSAWQKYEKLATSLFRLRAHSLQIVRAKFALLKSSAKSLSLPLKKGRLSPSAAESDHHWVWNYVLKQIIGTDFNTHDVGMFQMSL